jgi:dienelactone hydrolase
MLKLLTLALTGSLLLGGLPNSSLAADDAHLAWDRALVVLPGGRNTTMREAVAARDFDKVPPGTPTVVYLHGSTGMTPHDPTQFGKAGFLVIGPDSMARANRPVNRTLPNNVASFPQAPSYRLQEIKYALSQLPTVPNVDMRKLVLFGHSEGGKAAANWTGPEFRAVIMTGWNCHTRDTFFNGLKVPKSSAVMNIVAKRDNEIASDLGASCAGDMKGYPIKEVINPDGAAHWMNNVYLPDILRFMRDNTR